MEVRSVGTTSNLMLGERNSFACRWGIGDGGDYGASASVSGGDGVTPSPPPGVTAAIRPKNEDADNRSVAILQSYRPFWYRAPEYQRVMLSVDASYRSDAR
jgi:hypothetical protein